MWKRLRDVTREEPGSPRKEKGKRLSENGSTGSRGEYLARIRRFTDEMLDRLNEASRGRDVDDKETRALRNAVLKALRIWDKALLEGQRDPRLEEKLQRVEKQASQVKSAEA
jgi:hypothetical protein